MTETESHLAVCLGLLLNALAADETPVRSGEAVKRLESAREAAAKALIQHRIRRGGDWRPAPDTKSFFEQWRRMNFGGRGGDGGSR